jgi:predicted NBD/HSP70 family sugar kinase
MYVLFDIGGTKTRIATSRDLLSVDEVAKFDTPPKYEDGMREIETHVTALVSGGKVEGVAGGIRGPLNHEKTGIISETTLRDWVGRNITGDLGRICGAPVYLENDTAMVGLGEVHFGAGKGYDIVAYHTVSTGVGGARFVHGKIDVTSVGFEPGHQVLDIDQTVLGRHTPPTLQNLVSGTALEKRRGVKPYEISQDDAVWDELARYLAHGLKNTIVYWSPDIIVLGGSMVVGDPRIFLKDIVRHTREVLGGLVPCPPIVDAKLKDEGGLYGAMALLKLKLGQNSK